jgi:hypothetical protein
MLKKLQQAVFNRTHSNITHAKLFRQVRRKVISPSPSRQKTIPKIRVRSTITDADRRFSMVSAKGCRLLRAIGGHLGAS